MLELTIGQREGFNEETNEFFEYGGTVVRFEHSLKSISKWESKWGYPFLSPQKKSSEEMLDYLLCMAEESFDPSKLTQEDVEKIAEYINTDQSKATTVRSKPSGVKQGRILSGELIYAYMSSLAIPIAAENWHISKLIKTIETIGALNNQDNKEQKMSKSEVIAQNRRLNEERKKKLQSKG